MERTEIKEIFKNKEQYLGKEVTICGWIKQIRDSKTFGFIELNDGSFFKNIQINLSVRGKSTTFVRCLEEVIWNRQKRKEDRNV